MEGTTMSWTDFYQRRDAIDEVLRQAGQDVRGELPYEGLPQVTAQFASREDLALALQYKWSQLLLGRITVALNDAEHSPDVDHVEAVSAAYRKAVADNPVLRELLDNYTAKAGPEFLASARAEQRMVALAAGLAEYGEAEEEIARVGAAFVALVRGSTQRSRGRRTIDLLRMLVAN
jgi:hypothetical protein